MKAALIFTGSGPIVILTSYESLTDETLIAKLRAKGLEKWIAFELPLTQCRQRYGAHFDVVCEDLQQADDLRVLDYNGHRVLELFRFDELGEPIFYEPAKRPAPQPSQP